MTNPILIWGCIVDSTEPCNKCGKVPKTPDGPSKEKSVCDWCTRSCRWKCCDMPLVPSNCGQCPKPERGKCFVCREDIANKVSMSCIRCWREVHATCATKGHGKDEWRCEEEDCKDTSMHPEAHSRHPDGQKCCACTTRPRREGPGDGVTQCKGCHRIWCGDHVLDWREQAGRKCRKCFEKKD